MNNENLIEILKKAKKPLSVAEICKKSGEDESEVKALINTCIHEGLVVAAKGGKYAYPPILHLTLCRAKILMNAPAFAKPVSGNGYDFYLDMPEEQAFDGDLIFVKETQAGEKRRGTLAFIVKRARSVVTGTLFLAAPEEPHHRKSKRGRPRYVPEDEYFALIPDRRFPARVRVSGELMGAMPGDLCVFDVTRWPLKGREMALSVKQVLGRDGDMSAQLSALCAMHGIGEAFSDETVAYCESLGTDPAEADMAGRRDYRNETVFTVDGADAKDFDDAVSLTETESGYTLGVHIADVSHYVREDSALDGDARERGTSVYLPGRTVPMLPEALSNCLCSLMPNVNRLTMSCVMELDRAGNVLGYTIGSGVIRSCARLTYEEVNKLFAGETNNVPEALHDTLRKMNELAKVLKAERVKKGSLELDLPEPQFELDEQLLPTRLSIRPRGEAHELIEEFMLMANRTVARHAMETNLPFPYRVHEQPDGDKLTELEDTLFAMGVNFRIGASPTQQKLQALIEHVKNRPQSVIVSTMLLRCMSKAHYSEKPLGHYGLAFKDYCHFTSPIRRYPDLLAHRMLKKQAEGPIDENTAVYLTDVMHTLTSEASENEEQAARCEREADGVMTAAYLSRHRNEVFTVTVTRFAKKGVFASLESGCEGLIPYRNMDDFYSTDDEMTFMIGKRSKRIVRLGDKVRVKPADIDIPNGLIEFYLLEEKKSRRK